MRNICSIRPVTDVIIHCKVPENGVRPYDPHFLSTFLNFFKMKIALLHLLLHVETQIVARKHKIMWGSQWLIWEKPSVVCTFYRLIMHTFKFDQNIMHSN